MLTVVPFHLFVLIDTAPTDIYPLSLHDALPISRIAVSASLAGMISTTSPRTRKVPLLKSISLRSYWISMRGTFRVRGRSEEHTSELQSRGHLVCRLLLEKKNIKRIIKE